MLMIAMLLFLANASLQQSVPAQPPVKEPVATNDSGKEAGESQHQGSVESPQIVCNGCTIETQPKTQGEKPDSYNPKEDTLYRMYLWFTIVGVVLALGGLAIIKSQTNTAKKNVDAVINAERAWVMTTLGPLDHVQINDWEKTPGQFFSVVHLRLGYTNVGKVPCWVTDKAVWFKIPESIPLEPVFNDPTKRFVDTEPLIPQVEHSTELPHLTCEGVHVMTLSGPNEGGNNIPIVYGYVRYRDPFGHSRETRFGYMVKGHHWQRIPLETYNRNT